VVAFLAQHTTLRRGSHSQNKEFREFLLSRRRAATRLTEKISRLIITARDFSSPSWLDQRLPKTFSLAGRQDRGFPKCARKRVPFVCRRRESAHRGWARCRSSDVDKIKSLVTAQAGPPSGGRPLRWCLRFLSTPRIILARIRRARTSLRTRSAIT